MFKCLLSSGITALEDSTGHQNPLREPVVYFTNVSLNSVIYHLEPRLIIRPASVNGLFTVFPRCQFMSTLWMLDCWKPSLGQVRSLCSPLCAHCLILGMGGGGDDRPVGLDGTEEMIDGSASEPSSMHDLSMSHRV